MKFIKRILGSLDLVSNRRDSFATFEEPIRHELFSAEPLEQHAKSLAAIQKTTDNPRKGKSLTPRIHANG